MKKPKLWYVITDGGRARFVERDDQGAFRTLSSFVSTELHKAAHQLGRDRPARVRESASPARSATPIRSSKSLPGIHAKRACMWCGC